MMSWLAQSFFWFLAAHMHRDLARQVEYLTAENRILRGKLPKQVAVTEQERSVLLRLGKAIGKALYDLMSIVTPRTFQRWVADEKDQASQPRKVRRKQGPRPKPPEVRELIVRLATENEWGYTRIAGELKKLNVQASRSTVVNVLKENGLEPGPDRGTGSWDAYLKRHWKTLWATDFLTVPVWTVFGRIDYYVLFFLHVGSRRVYVPAITANPTGAWVAQQGRNFAWHLEESKQECTLFLRDNDKKFPKEFDAVIESEGGKVKKVGPVAPNMNAHAERFVQAAKGECLGRFTFFSEQHLKRVLDDWLEHYNEERPHQGKGKGNAPLPQAARPALWDEPQAGEVICKRRLGGVLKNYARAA